MNYLPFAGGWFYGAGLISGEQMAAHYCSWGLLDSAPIITESHIFNYLFFRRRRRK